MQNLEFSFFHINQSGTIPTFDTHYKITEKIFIEKSQSKLKFYV